MAQRTPEGYGPSSAPHAWVITAHSACPRRRMRIPRQIWLRIHTRAMRHAECGLMTQGWPVAGASLDLRSATALEPDRAVLPVVDHHQRPAGGHGREKRARRGLRIDRRFGRQREERDRSHQASRGAVVAALAEDPHATTQGVVLN